MFILSNISIKLQVCSNRRISRNLAMAHEPKIYDITIFGNENVGKSSLLLSYSTDKASISRTSTIGAQFSFKTLYSGEIETKVKICDTAGAKCYLDLVQKYYTNCQAALLVYDIHNRESYEAVKQWVVHLRKKLGNFHLVLALAGNKCDMQVNREISIEEAETYAEEHDLIFLETSAMANDNVREIFEKIGNVINREGRLKNNTSGDPDRYYIDRFMK